ncbi:hypothetical protein [Streptomyces sp. NPDC017991]|uniref:hypothetical protein n=1 Tax=Streptomyces sp. NPDC017991 TaxID=3365026 RepID=UPI0037B0A30E
MAAPTTEAVRRDPGDAVRRDLETRLMDEPRQSPASGAFALPTAALPTAALLRRVAPPPALCGFFLLLALVFTASYAAGVSAGPVAPGMHGPAGTGGSGTGTDSGSGGADDMGDSGDSGDMGGMGDTHEGGR